ncbi:MAG: TraB/GumN family protein [Chitinophagaceae bacterium]|nr:TraB/GumN family protein [Chitinophagaceae bacterium]
MILFLPFLMLSAVMAFAEPKAITEADTTLEILNIDEISEPKALLWSVSGNGLTAPSYIYGTIHLICPDDFKISATLKEKIKEAKEIYLEMDMTDPSMVMKMAGLSIMKEHSLKDLLSETDYRILSKYVTDSIGLPMMLFNNMKPLLLMSALYTKVVPCSNPKSYEQAFMQMAKEQHKEVKGLETIEDQMSVFDKIPDSAEAQMLVEMITTMPKQRAEFAKMVEDYKKQDINALQAKLSESPEWKGFEDELLVNRNKNWIPIMKAAMVQGTQFFAVGAGHLPGKAGIIQLFKEAGYRVEPVEKQ